MRHSTFHHIKSFAETLWQKPKKIITWWRNRHNFVIMDVGDNSVTFSRRLFRHIKHVCGEADIQPKVFVFYTPATKCYGFAINVPFDQPTQLADIQYNSKHKCIGFESLNPTVAKMLYDYGVSRFLKPCKLTVTTQVTPQGRVYFQIERPHEQSCKRAQSGDCSDYAECSRLTNDLS